MVEWVEIFGGRMRRMDVDTVLCLYADRMCEDVDALLALASGADNRVAYNVLWTLTLLPVNSLHVLVSRRDMLVDMLLCTSHAGRERLLLTLLAAMPTGMNYVRVDYLDYCLDTILSAASPSIRAMCLKQAYAQCRCYPELLHEFGRVIGLLDNCMQPPAVVSVLRRVRLAMAKAATS